MSKKKILLVDDEKPLCDMIRMSLESKTGHSVSSVYSGKDAIELFKAQKFDLVITDYSMPGMNGEEVLDALRKIDPSLPVFILSIFHDDVSNVKEELCNKANAVIGKPIDYDLLSKKINGVLSR